VQQSVCPACWDEWLDQSKNIINHYGIQVADPAQRQQLYRVMAEFLKLPGVA
jgi:Fe-S cluster biosynthesis and repair protein YggX